MDNYVFSNWLIIAHHYTVVGVSITRRCLLYCSSVTTAQGDSNDFSASTVIVATPTAVNIQVGAGIGSSSNQLDIFVRNSNTGALTDAFSIL
jgi:hypothetical protein